ncbi:MAG: NifB/NifX family molybdenum-iron cluster-binding protein [Fusobacteriota bacterium]
MELKVACATDNGKKIKKDHFGDAKYYQIYRLSKKEIKYIKKISNPKNNHEHEDDHVTGDPKKANEISKILKKNGINVMLGYQIGPNIVRMKKKFVPVISRKLDIDESLKDLQKVLENIFKEYKKGKSRSHIILKNDQRRRYE